MFTAVIMNDLSSMIYIVWDFQPAVLTLETDLT